MLVMAQPAPGAHVAGIAPPLPANGAADPAHKPHLILAQSDSAKWLWAFFEKNWARALGPGAHTAQAQLPEVARRRRGRAKFVPRHQQPQPWASEAPAAPLQELSNMRNLARLLVRQPPSLTCDNPTTCECRRSGPSHNTR